MTDLRKKIAAVIATGTLLLNIASPALAASNAEATVGDDGDVYSYSNDEDTLVIEVDNDADIENMDLGVGLTGANFQYGNDDDGEIKTGDADGHGASANFANSTMGEVNEEENGSADADAEVGEDGFAEAYAYDNDVLEVLLDNVADVDNMTLGVAVSGFNFQYCNDDDNVIDTGDSEATATALNELNSTWLAISGSHTAEANASVGDDGDAFAYAEDNDLYRVDLDNDADLDNASIAVALSGFNSQDGNDDNGEIKTGKATAESNVENYLNTSVVVIGDLGGGAVATSDVGEDTAFAGGGCGECGGDGCHEEKCLGSDAYAYDNDTVVVEVDNDADVDNTSVAVAVSGGNTQSGNDDGNTIDTGDASGTSCSTNVANSTWIQIGGGSMPEGGDSSCN